MDDQLLQAQACCDNKAPDDQSFHPAIEVPGKVTSAVSIVSATEEVDISPSLRLHKLDLRPQSECSQLLFNCTVATLPRGVGGKHKPNLERVSC